MKFGRRSGIVVGVCAWISVSSRFFVRHLQLIHMPRPACPTFLVSQIRQPCVSKYQDHLLRSATVSRRRTS